MALCRLDMPGMMLYSGSIAPGKIARQDITIQDVFEGIGAYAAGKIDAAGLTRWKPRVSGRGRMRRPVHRQHHGHGARDPGHRPPSIAGVPATRRGK